MYSSRRRLEARGQAKPNRDSSHDIDWRREMRSLFAMYPFRSDMGSEAGLPVSGSLQRPERSILYHTLTATLKARLTQHMPLHSTTCGFDYFRESNGNVFICRSQEAHRPAYLQITIGHVNEPVCEKQLPSLPIPAIAFCAMGNVPESS